MFVKICGIHDLETAKKLFEIRPDAIGLNFYSESVRCVTPEVAHEICEACPPSVEPIGVFVNHSAEEIDAVCQQTGIRCVQLHGDEVYADYKLLGEKDYQVILVYRMSPDADSLEGLEARFDEAQAAGLQVRGILVDACAMGQFGGTGRTVRWDVIAAGFDKSRYPWLILAGGLNVDNVGEAVRIARPWGVDVASAVESIRGVKNIEMCRRFMKEAKRIPE